MNCLLCGSPKTELRFTYLHCQPADKIWHIPSAVYNKPVWFCLSCGVFFIPRTKTVKKHIKDYELHDYYGNKLKENFIRIMSIPYRQSSNKQRIFRVVKHIARFRPAYIRTGTRLLDIGCGLSVFGQGLSFWGLPIPVTGIEKDDSCRKFANAELGTSCYKSLENIKQLRFGAITFNRVLEHIKDPVKFTKEAISLLAPNGICYIEVPSGRPENYLDDKHAFYYDHWFAFTEKSLSYLLETCGLKKIKMESIIDAEGIETIYCFAER